MMKDKDQLREYIGLLLREGVLDDEDDHKFGPKAYWRKIKGVFSPFAADDVALQFIEQIEQDNKIEVSSSIESKIKKKARKLYSNERKKGKDKKTALRDVLYNLRRISVRDLNPESADQQMTSLRTSSKISSNSDIDKLFEQIFSELCARFGIKQSSVSRESKEKLREAVRNNYREIFIYYNEDENELKKQMISKLKRNMGGENKLESMLRGVAS